MSSDVGLADTSLYYKVREIVISLNIFCTTTFSTICIYHHSIFGGRTTQQYKKRHAHNILCVACLLWGMATLAIAKSQTVIGQAFFRSVNGGALASILPLSQMMLVDLVPVTLRGTAFGLLGLCEKISATLSTSAVVWYDDWRIP